MANILEGDIRIRGNLTVDQTVAGAASTTPTARTYLTTDTTQIYSIPLSEFRIWDAVQTNLTTAGTDDLGFTAGAFGTGVPYIVSRDLNALGATTGYARAMFSLPPEYVSGGPITVRLNAGMITSVASVSATVDVEAYLCARSNLVSGSDLCTTSATTMNSTTFAEKDFTITPTGRVAGDKLDLRIAFIGNSATASSHFAAIANVDVLLSIKG